MNRSCGTHHNPPGTSTRSRRATSCGSRSHPTPPSRWRRQTGRSGGTLPGPAGSRVVCVTERAAADETLGRDATEGDVAALIPMLRRIVAARVGSHPSAEDLVQETLVRVLAARDRIEPGMVEPYAIATVRNVMATMWREQDREQRNRHRAHDPSEPEQAGAGRRHRGAAGHRRSGAAPGRQGPADAARARGRRGAHEGSRAGPGHARRARSRHSSSACVPGCGSSTSWPSSRSSRPRSDAAPCSWLSPAPTDDASAKSKRLSTSWSASSVPGSVNPCSAAARSATTSCGS